MHQITLQRVCFPRGTLSSLFFTQVDLSLWWSEDAKKVERCLTLEE
jgi:hypothetical protein